METKEKRFEQDIETFFLLDVGGYVSLKSSQFDVDKCICMNVLCQFIEKTQPKAWAKYLKYYGENAQEKLYFRLKKCICEQDLIYVFRHGIEDLGIKLKVCYFKPETTLNDIDVEHYEANILGCTRQFRCSPHSTNTIDMVLSVNGIPVVSIITKSTAIRSRRKQKCSWRIFLQTTDFKLAARVKQWLLPTVEPMRYATILQLSST